MRSSGSAPTSYPLATVAAYGPDSTRATKLVVGVVRRAGEHADVLRTWTTETGDVREDRAIAAEVLAWVGQHGVKQTLKYDGIIGCPHEEGIDYPIGRSCPRCPFWAGIDRFTHEPIPGPVARMSPEQVLIELGPLRTRPPREALESADAHREALVPLLLAAIERGLTEPAALSDEDAQRFSYALYLLAKWRETRVYPLVIRWFLLPEQASTTLTGDVLTQDGARILAAVFDGDLAPIQRLILNRDADQFSRGVAVSALALLAVWAEVPRDTIVDYFVWLAREGLEREPGYVWGALASECADIEALAAFPALYAAYDKGFIDPRVVGRHELGEVERMPRGDQLDATRDRYPPIGDVTVATSWWMCFARQRGLGASWGLEPVRSQPKVGRNDPCPCGSGKKYKKCCGR